MKKSYNKLILDTSGQGMVEYGLIISLVILAAIGALELFGIGVRDLFRLIGEDTSKVI